MHAARLLDQLVGNPYDPQTFHLSMVGYFADRKIELETGRYVRRRPAVEERTAVDVARLQYW